MLDDKIQKLAIEGRNFATVTTLMPDGTPQSSVLWIDADGDNLLLNTEVHRQKYRNVERDPRVTVVIWDADDAYTYGEVRGEVIETVTGPSARSHIDQLAQKYTGADYAGTVKSERVIVKVAPKHQFTR